MTAEQKALHQRILEVGDPASVTQAERNQIFLRPPPDEEDRLCQEKVGLTLAELKVKAMASADTLTETETNIIIHGADYERSTLDSTANSLWFFYLPDDERQLAQQVRDLLVDDYETEVRRRAHLHASACSHAWRARRKQERAAIQAAKLKAARPQWLHDMFDAKLPQWGFVIFRTSYEEGTEQKWGVFCTTYNMTKITQLCEYLNRAANLTTTHRALFVSDPSLNRASIDILRQRFKAMKEQNEIPGRIATDCFLVVDEAVLDHPVILSKTQYKVKTHGESDPWKDTLFLKAVNPDYDTSVSEPSEGEITIPLPKVFDWLYYCFLAKSEDWETRYKVTKEGPAELMVRIIPSLLGIIFRNSDIKMLIGSLSAISSIPPWNGTPGTLKMYSCCDL